MIILVHLPQSFPSLAPSTVPLPVRILALNTTVAGFLAASALQQVLSGVAVPAPLFLQLPELCTRHLAYWKCEDTAMTAVAPMWILFCLRLRFFSFWSHWKRLFKDLGILLNHLLQPLSNLIDFLFLCAFMAKLLLLVVIHIQVQKKHSIKIQTGVLHAFAILIFRSLQIALQIFKSMFSLNLQKI